MLTFHTGTSDHGQNADLAAAELPSGIVWLDLFDPTPEEKFFVERVTGLAIPGVEQLSEIESSSRLSQDKGALRLSTPVVSRGAGDEPLSSPVGFVLTSDRLITIRFAELPAFASLREECGKPDAVHPSSAGVFIALVDIIVDRLADALEHIGNELEIVSHRIFRSETPKTAQPRRPAIESANLREILGRIGRSGDLASKLRDSLLGFGRIVPYVSRLGADWLPADIKPRLDTARDDIASLNDYDMFLNNKVQFLLDATLGLINIEQNNIVKVLTIASVVGIPPTLVASMYGMNFKNMPELSWVWGYPYGLALIAASAVLPLVWFKLRGWL